MLKRAEIKNVLSCEGVILEDVPHITALVGRNSAGKSNIMRAIEWAARTAVSTKPVELTGPMIEHGRPNAIVTLDFVSGDTTYRYQINLQQPTFANSNDGHLQIVNPVIEESLEFAGGSRWYPVFRRHGENLKMSRSADIQIGALTPSLPALGSLLPQDDPTLKKIQPAISFLRRIHYYPLDEPNVVENSWLFVDHKDYAQWVAENEQTLDPSSSVIMRLIHMSLVMKEQFEELKQLVGQNGLSILSDINIEALQLPLTLSGTEARSETAKTTIYFVSFNPTGDPRRRQAYGGMSFGTRRLLRILVSLIFDKSSLMLIEQPEDGIHPGLLHKLIPLLKTYSDLGQVILASHSPMVFNRLNPEEIRLVEMKGAATTLRALSAKEIRGAERYISEDGPLSDYVETMQEGD